MNTAKSSRSPGAVSPAGEATSTGQAGPRTPERVPPARATPGYCATCGHIDVLHNLSASGRRTKCSVHSGPKATPCGCDQFTAGTEPLPQEPTP